MATPSVALRYRTDAYQKALYDAEIPLTAFLTNDIHDEYKRLKERGVVFRGEPMNLGSITAVLFEDTCGNLIQCQDKLP